MTYRRRWRAIALAGMVLGGALALGTSGSPASAGANDKLNRSDWGDFCVNRNYRTGRAYTATPRGKMTCRELRVGTDRRMRRFVTVVPRSALEREGRIPVVFMLHGSSGTGEQYWQISRWRELAYEQGFIAVFPSALAMPLRESDKHPEGFMSTKWNHLGFDGCEASDSARPADDVAFIDAILRDLQTQIPNVDRRRTFVSGFSNGGQMAVSLAIVRGDEFGAVGAFGGTLPTPGDDCSYTVPDSDSIAPVWLGIGSLDDRFGAVDAEGTENDETLPMTVNGMEVYFNRALTTTTRALQLERQRTGTTTVDALVDVRDFTDGVAPVWSPVLEFENARPGNGSDNSLVFGLLDRCIHSYPNSWERVDMSIVRKSKDVAMADNHWQWFLDNPLPWGGR